MLVLLPTKEPGDRAGQVAGRDPELVIGPSMDVPEPVEKRQSEEQKRRPSWVTHGMKQVSRRAHQRRIVAQRARSGDRRDEPGAR